MRFLKWTWIFPLLTLAAHGSAQTGDIPLNEFRHRGGALVCFSGKGAAAGYTPCLRFGELSLGQSVGGLEEKIKAQGGRLERRLPPDGNGETRLYSLAVPDGQKKAPRLEVDYRKGKAVCLQLTGEAAQPAFSSIRLGDDAVRVVGLIGPPRITEEARESGGTWWDYRPFPIRIEFREGGVYSIRLGSPAPGPGDAGD